MQTDVPCGSAQFCAGLQAYYPPPLAQPALPPGKSLPLDWGPQPHDPAGNGHASYPHLQDEEPDPPGIYPGDGEYGLRRVAFSPQEVFRSADPCSLQTPLSSPQGHYPQSSVSFPPDHNHMTSTDHVISWSQASERGLPMTHNHHLPPCSMLSLPHPQSDGFRPVDAGSQAIASGAQCPTKVKSGSCLSYAGLPFPSVLQTGRGLEAPGGPPHYSPRPMLNPIRRGTGLYCNLLPLPCLQSHFSEQLSPWPEETCLPLPKVNLGPEFQAEVPQLLECRSHDHWPEESPMEQLLWKPWEDLEDSNDLQDQVENLLDLCSSSAMPGGGTNLELALHCLSRCQGDMLATVEMLLLSSPPSSSSSSSSSEDYHYSGSAVWTLSEKRLLNKAFVTHSKDFSLIQKMVKTKSVPQCVEFYYLSRKVLEQQRRQLERERVAREERSAAGQTPFPISHTLLTPVPMEEPVQSPSLAANFPCKQCGKMFYKIKSRNAHMKIHRQQQEDWRERGRPGPILTHSLAQSLPQNQARLTYLQPTGNHAGAAGHAGPNAASNALSNALLAPQHQSWDPFELTLDSGTFYFNSDGKVVLGVAGAPKGQISWQ
ncbi:transcriptional-regulating factor 1 [Conger conger]|uniref:transcriptional-regulating factor 1 n=1 Tax=Conger conger TaxID=82655 RepID=UPI002A599E8B|nr:transcriptional-regulating factor 1 [Conger conger]